MYIVVIQIIQAYMYLTFVDQQQLNEVAKESLVSSETGYTRNQNTPNMNNLEEQTLP